MKRLDDLCLFDWNLRGSGSFPEHFTEPCHLFFLCFLWTRCDMSLSCSVFSSSTFFFVCLLIKLQHILPMKARHHKKQNLCFVKKKKSKEKYMYFLKQIQFDCGLVESVDIGIRSPAFILSLIYPSRFWKRISFYYLKPSSIFNQPLIVDWNSVYKYWLCFLLPHFLRKHSTLFQFPVCLGYTRQTKGTQWFNSLEVHLRMIAFITLSYHWEEVCPAFF